MNLNCVICADLLNSSDDVCATQCGHIFHYVCLYQWLERSKSCPQCRYKCSEKTIHKVYFNIANLDTSSIDIGALQQQLDDMKLRMIGKEKELTEASQTIQTLKSDRKKYTKTISGLERELAEKKFLVFSYDEQLKNLKADNKLLEELRKEINELKAKNDLMTTIQDALTSSAADVENMLKDEPSAKTLCVLVTALKRELQVCQKRRAEVRETLRSTQNDLRKEQKHKGILLEKISCLESANYRLNEQVKGFKTDVEVTNTETSDSLNLLEQCTAADVRVSLLRDLNFASSPSISDRIRIIEESNSPYFNIKSSSVGLADLLRNSENIRNKDKGIGKEKNLGGLRKTTSDLSEKYSIFKKPRLEIQINQQTKPMLPNLSFNGIGGSERSVEFPEIIRRTPACDIKSKLSLSQRIKSGKLRKLPVTSDQTILDKFVNKN